MVDTQSSLFGIEIKEKVSLTGKPHESYCDILDYKEKNRCKKCCGKWYKFDDDGGDSEGTDYRCHKCNMLVVWTSGDEDNFLNQSREVKVDLDFIKKEDLRDWVFKEDKVGRFRERIIDEIEKFGVEKWFKEKGFPVTPKSIWKNRYVGSEETLNDYFNEHIMDLDKTDYTQELESGKLRMPVCKEIKEG
ncbi:MAG: hypothetical protein IMZ51_03835 [Chloroflexi bacterium]|nr:hypothetical protein [Chloroflexota bacterium]